jgi:superfamily II DNA or RNA helicase
MVNDSNRFSYQEQIAVRIIASIEKQKKPVVMAVTTSAGKSAITVRILENYFRSGPNRNAVFLGSNQTVLAQQYYDVLSKACPVPFNFSYSMLKDLQDSQLKIGLPKQLIRRPRKIGLLVLDEAHWLWPQIECRIS